MASYFFYMCWNMKYIVLLIASTVITYFGGVLITSIIKKNYDAKK